MSHDLYGQTTSLSDPAAIAAWNATMQGFLAHSACTPEHLGAVLRTDPDFALAQAVQGLFLMLMGRRELVADAVSALARAQRIERQGAVLPRERLYIDALADWIGGHPGAAVQRLEQVLRADPGDALAMKLGHAIRFVLGDATGMRRSVERVLPAYDRSHPGYGYLLGCHAFSLEETGDYARAETTGRHALWLAPDDAWGLHAVAHVHDMTGCARRGLDWLEGREGAWAHCNNFRFHVCWHKALMYLDLGRIDAVLALYDREIRAERTDDYRDIANATALLMRLDLEGVDVADRWQELADLAETRTQDGCLIFADLHYLLALNGDSRDAAAHRLIRRIGRDAARSDTRTGRNMAHPGRAAAAGLRDFAEGRFASAFAHLSAARGDMQRVGGSHAQRDLFERMTIDAGIRAGQFDAAEAILNDRSRRRSRDDGYAHARRDMIAAGRGAALDIPAQ
ncbi:tetratricopeptide repeat protein [Pukyongiella litopenaei]|uniref:Tetratricopeptide repeat protein 38 n=1 Tax=Pukyongiella litopenaei TaxID=2605946 RepID=A0A2S0MRV4_9RHOB|nr:tetratricopeptide repeat protein [Pukyongiella litopenaei]AVO38602.1 tetratricopeptide repeat protein [Pukyongiella litopenaei]